MSGNKEWMAMAEPNAEWEETVKTVFGGFAPDIGLMKEIAPLRQMISNQKKGTSNALGKGVTGFKETDHQVKMRDGAEITCRVHAPENPPAGGSPLFVVYHGGGWCIGGLENEELLCRLTASKFGVTCVNVGYRLAPEHKFPTAVYDCHDATKWAVENAASFGADPTKGFLIGGTSAGGALTSSEAHLWRDEKLSPPMTGCLYMIPFLVDAPFCPEKYKADHIAPEQNANAAVLGRKAMDLFANNYIPDVSERGNHLFSTLLWPTGHADLPPSAFMVCGADPLRDDGLIFERLLREEHGTKTKLMVYPGLPHGFWSMAPMMKVSEKFVQDSVDCVKWLLEQKA